MERFESNRERDVQAIKSLIANLENKIPATNDIHAILSTADIILEIKQTLKMLVLKIPDLQNIKKTLETLDTKIPDIYDIKKTLETLDAKLAHLTEIKTTLETSKIQIYVVSLIKSLIHLIPHLANISYPSDIMIDS